MGLFCSMTVPTADSPAMTNISPIASGRELSRRSVRLYKILRSEASAPCGVGGSWPGSRPRLVVLRPGAGWSASAGAASSDRMQPGREPIAG